MTKQSSAQRLRVRLLLRGHCVLTRPLALGRITELREAEHPETFANREGQRFAAPSRGLLQSCVVAKIITHEAEPIDTHESSVRRPDEATCRRQEGRVTWGDVNLLEAWRTERGEPSEAKPRYLQNLREGGSRALWSTRALQEKNENRSGHRRDTREGRRPLNGYGSQSCAMQLFLLRTSCA